jgi:hypothetical protein
LFKHREGLSCVLSWVTASAFPTKNPVACRVENEKRVAVRTGAIGVKGNDELAQYTDTDDELAQYTDNDDE